MVANPLTYTELEAFERKALVRFSAWETDLLMRVDDAVMASWAEQAPKPKPKGVEKNGEIPMSNTTGIRALFQGFKARKNADLNKRP